MRRNDPPELFEPRHFETSKCAFICVAVEPSGGRKTRLKNSSSPNREAASSVLKKFFRKSLVQTGLLIIEFAFACRRQSLLCANFSHSRRAHFPRTRTNLWILQSAGLRIQTRVSVLIVIRITQSLARCHSRTTPTMRRISTKGHHQQLDNAVCALSHNEPVWLSGRTSLNYTLLSYRFAKCPFCEFSPILALTAPSAIKAQLAHHESSINERCLAAGFRSTQKTRHDWTLTSQMRHGQQWQMCGGSVPPATMP